MIPRRTIGVMAAWLTAAVLVLSACSGGDVETKSESDVTAVVQQHADAIAAIAGQPLENPNIRAGQCTGKSGESSDKIYSVQGVYNLAPPANGSQLDVIARVRADWKAKGHT